MVHPFVLARGYSDSPRFCAIIANKLEFRARPVRACVLTPAAGNGKDLVQILSAIQHTHDLSHTIRHAIKDDMRTCDDRAKARSDLASDRPAKGCSSSIRQAWPISRTILSAVDRPAAPK